ncbi:uncharacterized protein LOC108155149 [Drosophila miranda]|uniref:uncharacterized protein LOC108155149 n=1 Tax=Drosophila miranda TaxID=7229 RepID=UPI0007E80A86|nr:uncharacterized protein LOC108155149 [Drosophila miranda]
MALDKFILLCCCIHFAVCADSFEMPNRNTDLDLDLDLEAEDSMVDTARSLEPGQPKQIKILQHSAGYTDYEYYQRPRPGVVNDHYGNGNGNGNDNDLSASSAMKRLHEETNRRPVSGAVPHKPLPWYGEYSGKPSAASVPMYPSRSYDPYIRRYDRFDEQYHRAYPQYFEDMYMHRQRFDPYDSYSPRVPHYPEPYVMYPDRYLDTPSARDYIKSRRGYIDDPVPLPDSYNSKYGPSPKLSDLTLPMRNQRVVYYAHLPEIVRTPYDSTRPEERNSAAMTMPAAAPYKLNKKKIKSNLRPLGNNSTGYKMTL